MMRIACHNVIPDKTLHVNLLARKDEGDLQRRGTVEERLSKDPKIAHKLKAGEKYLRTRADCVPLGTTSSNTFKKNQFSKLLVRRKYKHGSRMGLSS